MKARAIARLQSLWREQRAYLGSLLFSVSAALVFGAVLIAVTGKNPFVAYGALLQGALGSGRGIGNVLNRAVLLCVTGLATAIGARAGIFNVGGEGQLYLGALAAALVGTALKGFSAWLAMPLAFAAAMIAGGAYAWIPGVLKVKGKINEVIVCVMLNSAAIFFCSYLVNGPLKSVERGVSSGTNAIDPAYKFARLIPASMLTTSIVYAALIAVAVWYVMQKTSLGYQMKMTGLNPRNARYGGLHADRITLASMVVSGMLCGIAGLFLVYGDRGRFVDGISKDLYFDGLLVAMIARYMPPGIVMISLFFGILKVGSNAMELSTGISSELIMVVQSIIIFFMAAQEGWKTRLSGWGKRRRSKEERGAEHA